MFREAQKGLFWLPESPDRQVEGSVDPLDPRGLTLTIHGVLSPSNYEHRPNRIIGATAKGYVTLMEPVFGGRKQEFNRYTESEEEIWRCRYAFQGECSDVKNLDKGIKSAKIEIQSLRTWASTGREMEHSGSLGHGSLSWSFDSSPPRGKWLLGEVAVEHFIEGPILRYGGSLYEAHIAVNSFFRVNFDQSQALASVQDTASSLQALLCVSKGEAVAINNLSVTLLSGASDINLKVHYDPVLKAEGTATKSSELLTLQELGGIDGIGRWMDVLRNQTILKNALLADRYRPPIFVTDQTGHLLLACEAIERKISKNSQGHLNLKRILDPARDELGAEFFDWIGGDWDRWTTVISKVRNQQIAHLQNYPNSEGTGQGVSEINRQLYTVLIVRLLRLCGCSNKVIEEVIRRSSSDAVIHLASK